jgi:protein-S-isoprenylcysteine O-methyltransferase Ste14
MNRNPERRDVMNKDKKMVLGYLAGGLLVLGIMPSVIYLVTLLLDDMYRIEIFRNPVLQWIIVFVLLLVGMFYGIWSILIQNIQGRGGPLEVGNVEISPRTENLVVSRPYKNTRNPMLFGTFLIYLAFALFLNSINPVLVVVAIFAFMLTVVVKMEEKRLLKDFGNQYEEYRKKVSKFIPWFQRKIN